MPTDSSIIEDIIIRPSQIHFLRFILEAYEGLAVVSTVEPKLGVVRLSIAPGCEEDVHHILHAESETLRPRPLETSLPP